MMKAGAQRVAAELGLALIAPDTSPRGANVPGEADSWDLGVGAGFYLDATEAPWATNWRMESWLMQELLPALGARLPIDCDRLGIFGHSMGGHGALTVALKNPGTYRSVSAFAPICSPMNCPWGEKALTGYLGQDRGRWRAYDACALLEDGHRVPEILVDQGLGDQFLATQLKPELLEAACREAGVRLNLRRQEGYDHSYYFMASFMGDHVRHHASALGAAGSKSV